MGTHMDHLTQGIIARSSAEPPGYLDRVRSHDLLEYRRSQGGEHSLSFNAEDRLADVRQRQAILWRQLASIDQGRRHIWSTSELRYRSAPVLDPVATHEWILELPQTIDNNEGWQVVNSGTRDPERRWTPGDYAPGVEVQAVGSTEIRLWIRSATHQLELTVPLDGQRAHRTLLKAREGVCLSAGSWGALWPGLPFRVRGVHATVWAGGCHDQCQLTVRDLQQALLSSGAPWTPTRLP